MWFDFQNHTHTAITRSLTRKNETSSKQFHGTEPRSATAMNETTVDIAVLAKRLFEINEELRSF
jgi:hypothetical protein